MKKIAFTFAGRKNRMLLQVDFMREALNTEAVDEWHIWDFARDDRDKKWLDDNFGNSRFILTDSRSTDYCSIGASDPLSTNLWIRARNDAHILLAMSGGGFYEIVLGAHKNSIHLVRYFANPEDYVLNASPVLTECGGLSWGVFNEVNFSFADGFISVCLNGINIFKIRNKSEFSRLDDILIHTGYGSDGLWSRTNPSESKIKLITSGMTGYQGFKSAYRNYSDTFYSDSTFLKLDDDIIFCDVDKLAEFTNFVESTSGSDIYSANVLNNGVCAYYQSQKQYFSDNCLIFDYPPDGTCGELWSSSVRCEELHSYFIKNKSYFLCRAHADTQLTELPLFDRFSINFIAFRQPVLVYMLAAYATLAGEHDDEHIMTKILPQMFGVRKFIFNSLVVSHLSFFKQEETLDWAGIVDSYTLMSKYAPSNFLRNGAS